MEANNGVLPLPVMKNSKTVDPRDKNSTPVFQLEQAMGAAIECFEGASAINVPRSRFAPVKTTGDLLALRSDAYEMKGKARIELAASRKGVPPVLELSSDYKFVDDLASLGVPSLIKAEKLSVSGAFHFGEEVKIEGVVSLENTSESRVELSQRAFTDGESLSC